MDAIDAAIAGCDLFVSIGTSGAVFPAAGFVGLARAAGARTLEINLDPSAGTHLFDEARHGPAGRLVPALVAELLERWRWLKPLQAETDELSRDDNGDQSQE